MSRRFRGVGRITGLGGGSVLAAITAGVGAGVGVGSWLTKSNAAHRPSPTTRGSAQPQWPTAGTQPSTSPSTA